LIGCKEFMEEIANYLEGEVAADLRLQLEHHLSHCQTCRVVVDSTRRTLKIVTESGSFDLPEETFRPIARKIMARIRGGPE
jgi:hypothetical protein